MLFCIHLLMVICRYIITHMLGYSCFTCWLCQPSGRGQLALLNNPVTQQYFYICFCITYIHTHLYLWWGWLGNLQLYMMSFPIVCRVSLLGECDCSWSLHVTLSYLHHSDRKQRSWLGVAWLCSNCTGLLAPLRDAFHAHIVSLPILWPMPYMSCNLHYTHAHIIICV